MKQIQSYLAGELVRTYTLAYEPEVATGRSRIHSITEADANGIALSPTVFTWQGGTPEVFSTLPPMATTASWQGSFLPMDYNGDGHTDLVNAYQNGDSLQLTLFQSDGQRLSDGIALPVTQIPYGAQLVLMDVNGDGCMDPVCAGDNNGNLGLSVLLVQADQNGYWQFTLAGAINGAGPSDLPWGGTLLAMDVDGDGLADLVYAYENNGTMGLAVLFSNGSSFAWPSTDRTAPTGDYFTQAPLLPLDVNGDQMTDLVYAYQNGDNFAFTLFLGELHTGPNIQQVPTQSVQTDFYTFAPPANAVPDNSESKTTGYDDFGNVSTIAEEGSALGKPLYPFLTYANAWRIGFLTEKKVSTDSAGTQVLRWEKKTYDATTMNLTSHQIWDDQSSQWQPTTYSYDVCGNQTSITDVSGAVATVTYDEPRETQCPEVVTFFRRCLECCSLSHKGGPMNTAIIATADYADGLSPIDPQTLLQSPGMQKPTRGPRPWGHLAAGETGSIGWEAPIVAAYEARVRRKLTTDMLPRRPVVLNRRARRAMRPRQRRRVAADVVRPRSGTAPRHPANPQGVGASQTRTPGLSISGSSVMQPPTFTQIPSTLTFGPPTDISMGWDGTLWAIDASGAPHLYDPIHQQWQALGTGVDAVALIGSDIYHFRGSEYVKVTFGANQTQGPPVSIGTTWPNLPDSFKLGVHGAANVGGQLYLFRGGWYVPAAGSAPPAKLTALQNWPQAPNWVDGVIDAAGTDADGFVRLYHGAEYIVVNIETREVYGSPSPMADNPDWKPHIPAEWAASGIDALIAYGGNDYTVYKGPAFVTFTAESSGSPAQPQYLPSIYTDWPATWHPLLLHAPSGRMGNLYGVAKSAPGASSGTTIQHDGEHWNDAALPNPAQAIAVSVGQDGTTYAATAAGLLLRDEQGWTPVTTPPGPLADVAVGDQQHIWVRSANQVQRYGGGPNGTFTAYDLGVPVADMAANFDGTVWHASQNSAYRYISESVAPDTPPAPSELLNGPSGVQRVASTGFGQGGVLCQQNNTTQLYVYDSPYLFKTGEQYDVSQWGVLEAGLGNLYFVSSDATGQNTLVALNAHTGQPLWTTPFGTTSLTQPVFDPLQELIYTGSSETLLAWHARDGKLAWAYTTKSRIDAPPAIVGKQLCFGAANGMVYMLDSDEARQSSTNNREPTPVWTYQTPTGTKATSVQTPLLANGQVYVVTWQDNSTSPVLQYDEIVTHLDAMTGAKVYDIELPADASDTFVPIAPVLGHAMFSGEKTPALFVNGYSSIWAVSLTTPAVNKYEVKAPQYGDTNYFSSPMTLSDQGALFVGDFEGTLYALDAGLAPLYDTPRAIDPGNGIFTKPIIVTDSQGNGTALIGSLGGDGVWGYDFTMPSPTAALLATTNLTSVTVMSRDVSNGIVYVGGTNVNEDSLGQIFALRIDQAIQDQRDVIIESQLLQDPDPTATGGSTDPTNPIPPSVARYQTHLTVVDDQKSPLPHEPVKIWADQAVTITVDGQPFAVGPGDSDYAAVKTGIDGSLVIVSDATDLFASPLRVWAGFMDPYERIVVNPDQEFHMRVTTAHANAADDDPDKVNLVTAHNYNGSALFTDAEKRQGQPQNCANAVGQMNQRVGLDGGASKATYANVLQGLCGERPAATAKALQATDATPETYLAYADLTGASHYPTNIPARRPITILQPGGLHFTKPQGQPATAASFTALAHTDALAAIDALTGTPWASESLSGAPGLTAQRLGSMWSDFWHWLKGVVAEITDVIVAVAEDVVVGIRMIVNGVEQVFKAVIHVVEDIAAAIGSFFRMLLKAIEDVIAALSVLFHFGEIIKTHKWMANQINTNIALIADAVKNQVKQPMDAFFNQGEQAITQLFDNIRGQLGLNDNTQVNDLQGGQSTAHTAFAAAPGGVGPTSGGSSHAVQCTHASQKLKTGLPSAQQASATAALTVGDDDGDLSTFVTTFVDSLQNNATVKSAFNTLSKSITDLGQSHSAQGFFKSAVNVLLTIVEDLILGMVAVTQALMDGLIQAIDALIDTLQALLDTPIQIPFLSWLYQLIFNEQLTILNAITLVAAIPITIIYRVVEGHYPSADGIDAATVGSAAPLKSVVVTPDVIKTMQGLIGGCIALGLGIARGVVDEAGANPPRIGTIFVLEFGLAYVATYYPLMLPGAAPTTDQWVAWGLGVGLACLGTFGVISLKNAPQTAQNILKVALTFLRVGLAVARLIVFIVMFSKTGNKNAVTDVGFARNLFLELPPLFNWLKLFKATPANIVLTVIDVVTGVVVLALDITLAFLKPQAPGESRPQQI